MKAMTNKAILCADAETLQHPEALGLPDERLDAQPWLTVFSNADEARARIAGAGASADVWVAGSDQMDAINLAAAIRHDGGAPSLVAFQGSGSLYSRAHAAGIGEVLDKQAFLQRYGEHKQSALIGAQVSVSANDDALAGFSTFVGGYGAPSPAQAPAAATASSVHIAQGVQVPTSPPASAVDSVSNQGATVIAPSPSTLQARAEKAGPQRRMIAVAPAQGKSQVITVVGAGGGMGKSTLAVSCACLAQQAGQKTVVLDADLQAGDVHYLLGAEDALRIDALIDEPGRVESLKTKGRFPAVVAAPDAVEKSEMVAPLVKDVCALLSTRFDVVVVNTPPSWSDLQMDLIGISSRVLFVLDQRPTALRLAKRVLELCSRCGVASRSFVMALNRCDRQALFSSIDVSCTLSGIHTVELREGGRELTESFGSGAPFDAIDARNAYCESVKSLLGEVLAGASSVPDGGQAKKRRRWGRRKR